MTNKDPMEAWITMEEAEHQAQGQKVWRAVVRASHGIVVQQ